MTLQEVKDYIAAQLVVPVNVVSKIINSFNKVLDFISESSVDSVIPEWNSALTFQTDGTDDGKYCTYADTNGKKRIFETKTDDNTGLGHEPPSDPEITENTYWEEISQAGGSAIKEWEAGLYGAGLIIVHHNHSVDGIGLYLLTEAARPFASTNIETEIAAGKWKKYETSISLTAAGTDTYTSTPAPAISGYTENLRLFVKFTNANTGAATLNLNGLGAKSIKKNGTTDLASGDIAAGQILQLIYDGTNFQVVGGAGSGSGTGSIAGPLEVTQATLGNKVASLSSTSPNDDPTIEWYQNRITTTDATPTNLFSFPVPLNNTVYVQFIVIARRTGGSSGANGDSAVYNGSGPYKNIGGTVTLLVSGGVSVQEDQAGWSCAVVISGSNLTIQVTGAANNNITWHLSEFKVVKMGS